jgi:hypothetical protein
MQQAGADKTMQHALAGGLGAADKPGRPRHGESQHLAKCTTNAVAEIRSRDRSPRVTRVVLTHEEALSHESPEHPGERARVHAQDQRQVAR